MITRMTGKFVERGDHSVTLDVGGVGYEIFVAASVLKRNEDAQPGETLTFITFHYQQTDPSKAVPILIGFNSKLEREFFERFITVSGVGPKAALRALSVPISQIAQAIDNGDNAFLKTLPGVGDQRAREIVAKLQGKVGRFGLIQDGVAQVVKPVRDDLREEAVAVLLQLQYRKDEAQRMVDQAIQLNRQIKSVEELLNEVYRQRSAPVQSR